MTSSETPQTFLFTFRSNEKANDLLLIEVLVEQLADYDPSVADSALKSSWFGNEETVRPMLLELGFENFDINGVLGALRDHRDADRRLQVTTTQLKSAGFKDVA